MLRFSTVWNREAFDEGWAFVLPIFPAYLLFWFTGVRFEPFLPVLLAIQAFTGFLAIRYAFKKFQGLAWTDRIFWIGIVILCAFPGAYLEYPSDAWEHVQRLFSWQSTPTVADNPIRSKFSYFWGYTLLYWVPISWRFFALDLYSAFWLILLALSFYRFLRHFDVDSDWAKIHTVAFFLLFGSNVFNFRYYALSSTPLAYLAYLRGIRALRDFPLTLSKATLWIAVATLIAFNHRQELGFLVLATAVIAAWHLRRVAANRRFRLAVFFVVALGFLGGAIFFSRFPTLFALPGRNYFSSFGSFRLWSGPYAETLAVPGLLAILFTGYAWKANPRLTLLTLAPLIILFFPPTAWFIARFCHDSYDPYRMLYAMPSATVLLLGFSFALKKVSRRKALVSAALLVLILSLPARFPFRGKLYFHFADPPASRTLTDLAPTLEWIANRNFPKNCWIFTDDATQYALAAFLGWEPRAHRMNPAMFPRNIVSLRNWIVSMEYQPFCGYLVGRHELFPPQSPSKIASLSGHWWDDWGDLYWRQPESFELGAERFLVRWGWQKKPVAPYFWFFEPPISGVWYVQPIKKTAN